MTEGVGSSIKGPEYGCKFCHRKFFSPQALGGHQNAHKLERSALSAGKAAMAALWQRESHSNPFLGGQMNYPMNIHMPYQYHYSRSLARLGSCSYGDYQQRRFTPSQVSSSPFPVARLTTDDYLARTSGHQARLQGLTSFNNGGAAGGMSWFVANPPPSESYKRKYTVTGDDQLEGGGGGGGLLDQQHEGLDLDLTLKL